MSKKARRSKGPVEVPLRPGPNWPLLAISMLGVALTGYLSWTWFSGAQAAGCSAGGGCDVVLSSAWATLLGLPTAVWGLLAYAALGAIAFIRRVDKQWSYAFTVAFFGVCYSVYLTVVSLTILQSTCPYCLTSLALMATTLALVVLQRPIEMARRSWSAIAGRGVLAALIILVLHGAYTSTPAEPVGPEDPAIRALAEHLADQGALFYGASWCNHCQEQKRIFGASAARLPYIECSPGGPNAPQLRRCSAAGVRNYPTWVINGQAYPGVVMSLAQLAGASRFPAAAALQ